MTNDFIQQIVQDLYVVATHVASHPRGYCGFEVALARVLLTTVDLDALSDTIYSVLFVSNTYAADLTPEEVTAESAARRLHRLQPKIRHQQAAIQAHMAA